MNYDIKIKISTSNYFEIGKHVGEFHDGHNDSIHITNVANFMLQMVT